MNYDFVNTQLVIKDGKVSVKDEKFQDQLDQPDDNKLTGTERADSSLNENFSTDNSSVVDENKIHDDLTKRFKTFTIEEYPNTERAIYKVIMNFKRQQMLSTPKKIISL